MAGLVALTTLMLTNSLGAISSNDSCNAINNSYITPCAEFDNVDIPLFGNITSFDIIATHPTYNVSGDFSCATNFTNCPNPGDPEYPDYPDYPFPSDTYILFDDGETVIQAVREALWWQPHGMNASVNSNTPVTDIHSIRVSRKIVGANEWPQFFVLYSDGNSRLIPHPPNGSSSVCFASSVIIGSANVAERPIVNISSVRYISSSKTMEVIYRDGGSAILGLSEVNRSMARVKVTVNFSTEKLPFATFRSMYVSDGNADVDHIRWLDVNGVIHNESIMEFQGGEGSEWLFYRSIWSKHNPSGPDMAVKNFIAKRSPAITGSSPASPVNDPAGSARTFTLTSNQSVNVIWHINGTEVQNNSTKATTSSYTNTSAGVGIWNVTAIASNTNGSARQMWIWNVTSPVTSIPTIEFTYVPAYGSLDNLQGKVINVTPSDYKVAVYIYVSGWWTKPNFANPLTGISATGTWICDITTDEADRYATKIKAYLVPNGYTPPQMSGGQIFPSELDPYPNIEVTRKPERHITFSGYDWVVKSSVIPVGPGLNYFSDSEQSVWVDVQGQLHLKIINSSNIWYSSEVILANSFGYGKYVFHIASRVDQLDKNVVAGFFTWDDSAPLNNYREIDFVEFSKWGETVNDNSQYVVQPWDRPGNRYRFNISLAGNDSIHSGDWKNDSITYQSLEGSNIIGSWIYTGSYIPPPGKENVRINLWLFDPNNILGKPPSDGKEAEIIVTKFDFIAPEPVLTSINITSSNVSLTVGNSITFTAIPKDQYGNSINAIVTWNSINPSVGTINASTGTFKALSVGTTTITATSGIVSGNTTATVTAQDISDYYRGLTGSKDVVDTPDLLMAADDWSNNVIPAGFTESITTQQLLALANEWSSS